MKPGELRDNIIAKVQVLGAHGPLALGAPGTPGIPVWGPWPLRPWDASGCLLQGSVGDGEGLLQ